MHLILFLIFLLSGYTQTDIRPRFVGGLNRAITRLQKNQNLAKSEQQLELAKTLEKLYDPFRNYAVCLRNSVIASNNPVYLQNQTEDFFLLLHIFSHELEQISTTPDITKNSQQIITDTMKDLDRAKRGALKITSWNTGEQETIKLGRKAQALLKLKSKELKSKEL